MRRLFVIPVLLFGLLFAGGGFFMFSETALPMWQNWQRMQYWQPAIGRLESVSGSDNETRARYRYDYGGASYIGTRVGVSEVNDNIGAYQREMQAYLRRIQRDGAALPIWIDPYHPADAVIDRDMRWGLFALASGFCSVFIIIGVLVVYGSLFSSKRLQVSRRPTLWQMRKRWQRETELGNTRLDFIEYCKAEYGESETEPVKTVTSTDWKSRKGWEDAEIHSGAGKGALFWWGFGIFWCAVSSPVLFELPREIEKENYVVLVALMFPLVGLGLLGKALHKTLEYRRFGRVLLDMDPFPGAIGGHVGGRIRVKNLDYRVASEASEVSVTLECLRSYISGSGKNRSRREAVEWAERGRPKIDRAMQGVVLSFRFDVPGRLPEADAERGKTYHFWRLSVSADIPGIDLGRQFDIPVFATGQSSRSVRHDVSAQVAADRRREADEAGMAIASGKFDIDGLSRALRLNRDGNRLHLKFPMFRNKALTLFAAVFAGGFGFACYSMFGMIAKGGFFAVFLVLFSIPFFLVALAATIATVYLPFNNLSVTIEPGRVSVLRRLLFLPIYRRNLTRDQIDRLEIKRSGSTGQGVDKIEHFKVRAILRPGGGVTLAEDIDGEEVAGHFRDYLAQHIGVDVRR